MLAITAEFTEIKEQTPFFERVGFICGNLISKSPKKEITSILEKTSKVLEKAVTYALPVFGLVGASLCLWLTSVFIVEASLIGFLLAFLYFGIGIYFLFTTIQYTIMLINK